MSLFTRTGECPNRTYFWATDMIIVRKLTDETIRPTIESLISGGELDSACSEIETSTPQ